MARNLGPVCRLCRREGLKLFLKGERCYSDKCAIERRNYPPGAHGQARTRFSEFAIRLREKQKVKRIYGMMETQFAAYFAMAERMDGITGENLLVLLERRLDNVVYRLGFASSLAQARQVVRHGHVTVNGKKVNIPSYQVQVGDEIAIRESARKLLIVEQGAQYAAQNPVPGWLEANFENFTGRVLSLPKRKDVNLPINDQLIVELYSK